MDKVNSGKSGSVRVSTLDATDLSKMERHGLREDASGQARRVSDDAPLVFRGLNIRELCETHRAGRTQQGQTKACHALVQFPMDLIPNNARAQKVMMLEAVAFINDFYGGDAVFSARLDRDEKGTHKVDVFFLPRWDFQYKDGRTQPRCGLGQYTKKEAKRRFGKDDRRAQGSALQDSLFEHLRDKLRVPGVMPPERKATTAKDRVEPEVYALHRQQEKDALKRLRDAEETEDGRNQVRLAAKALDREREALRLQQEALRLEQAALAAKIQGVNREAAILIAAKLSNGEQISQDLEWVEEQVKDRSRSGGRERVRSK